MPNQTIQSPQHETKLKRGKAPGLKEIAAYLNLSPASVSMVINNAPLAQSLTPATRARILAAVKEFNYRPNLVARSLSMRESRTVGVIAPGSTDGYYTRVMRGIEQALLDNGYLYFSVSHLNRDALIREYPLLLTQRAVDGLIFINTNIIEVPPVPSISISHAAVDREVTSVLVDQKEGTRLSLKHLQELGHKRVLFMKGESTCMEAGERWRLVVETAQEVGIEVTPGLSLEMEHNQLTPELAYQHVRQMLADGARFTAVCAFNDVSAIGAMRALADFGLRCPDDVSVIGFDDIGVADYYTPRLTTIRQPLEEMGRRAVKSLIERIRKPEEEYPQTIKLQPELLVRESTGKRNTKVSVSKLRQPVSSLDPVFAADRRAQ